MKTADRGDRRRRSSGWGLAAAVAALATLGAAPVPAVAVTSASPGTITVTSMADDSYTPGTLRWAVNNAYATTTPTTIELPAGTYPLTVCPFSNPGEIDPGEGDLDLRPRAEVHVVGLGDGATIIQTCAGERVLEIGPDPTSPSTTWPVTLTNLTITGGTPLGSGGGIFSSGDLTLEATTVTGNRAAAPTAGTGEAGAPVRGGGIAALGTVTVTGGSLAANTAVGSDAAGGAIDAPTIATAGATFTSNTVAGTGAETNGGCGAGPVGTATGGALHGGTITVEGGAFTANRATGGAPGGAADGGAIAGNTVTISDATFENNAAIGGRDCAASGGSARGGAVSAEVATLVNADVTGNVAAGGTGHPCGWCSEPEGGAASGGGVRAATVTATGSTFTGNRAVGGAGGVDWQPAGCDGCGTFIYGDPGPGRGGAVYASSAGTLAGTTLAGNNARQPFRGTTRSRGREVWSDGRLDVTSSRATEPYAATDDSDADEALGAGGPLAIDHSTVRSSGLVALGSDAAVDAVDVTLVDGGPAGAGRLLVRAPTVSLRSVTGVGSGVWGTPTLAADDLTSVGSLLTAISGAFVCVDVAGTGRPTATSGGGNVARDPAGTCGLADPTDLVADDPATAQLSALGDHGGTTPTMVPWSANPALERADAPCATVFDQRGVARPQGARCDAGAVEVTGASADLTLRGGATPTGTVGAGSARHGDYTISNAGPDPATTPELRLVADGLDPASAVISDGGSCAAVPGGLRCTWPGPLPAGATRLVAVDGTVPTDGRTTDVVTALVGADGIDPHPVDNEVADRFAVASSADLAVTATPFCSSFAQRQCVTVTVADQGPNDAAASPVAPLRLRITLGEGLMPGPYGETTPTCPAGTPRVCTFTRETPLTGADPWIVPLTIADTGNLLGNTVTAEVLPAATPDPDPANDRATTTFLAPPAPSNAVAVAGRTATVSWDAAPTGPDDAPVWWYRVVDAGGHLVCSVSALSCTGPVWQNDGTPQTFNVCAYNGVASTCSEPSNAVVPRSGSTFHPLPPTRVLDQHFYLDPVVAGSPRTLTLGGDRHLLPWNATAVVMNVAVTGPTAASYLTLWPHGEPQPTAANLNFAPGQTIQNLVTVGVSSGGAVDFATAAGSAYVIADVVGYYTADDTGDRFAPVTPTRLLDSRDGTGGWTDPLPAGAVRPVAVRDAAGVPATATAVVANLTVTGGTANSYLTLWPSGVAQPIAANVNFAAGQTTSNLATVKIGDDGAIDVANASGSTDVVIDVVGYYDPGAGGLFHPVTPTRILDSRNDTGLAGPWQPDQDRALTLPAPTPADATAVAFNLTATAGTEATYVTAHPGGSPPPLAANLLVAPGETRPNLAIVGTGPGHAIALYNQTGSIHLIADQAGWFTPW